MCKVSRMKREKGSRDCEAKSAVANLKRKCRGSRNDFWLLPAVCVSALVEETREVAYFYVDTCMVIFF